MRSGQRRGAWNLAVQKCGSCHQIRRSWLREGQGYRCQDGRICDLLDRRTLELAIAQGGGCRLSIPEIHAVAEAITNGHAMATAWVDYATEWPETGEELIELAQYLHGLIFEPAGLEFAGKLRGPLDPDVIVDSGRHQIRGLPVAELPTALCAIMGNARSRLFSDDQGDIARGCAILLEGLFRAHPFLDGNGRVGRLLIRLYVRRTAQFEARDFATSGKSGRKYLSALRFARKALREDSGRARDPYGLLTTWVGSHVVVVPADDSWEEEEVP